MAAKVPGLYLRGKIFWFQPPMSEGLRNPPFSLETEDENTAIAKVLEWRKSPELREAGRWAVEVDAYLKERVDLGKMSPLIVESRRYLLLSFARRWNVERASQVTTAMVQAWYKELSKGVPQEDGSLQIYADRTCEDYVAIVRPFFSWLVAGQALASNPAKGIKMRRVMKVAKKDFVDRFGVRRFLAAARLETRRARAALRRVKKKQRESGDPRTQRYAELELQSAIEMELFLFMGFDAGMRKNEMVEARAGWFSKVAINVSKTPTFTPKDRDERSIPLTNRFRRFLRREFSKGLPAPWVVAPAKVKKPDSKGKYRYDPKKKFSLFFERWGKGDKGVVSVKGRIPNIHMLRHSFASNRLIGAPDRNGVVHKADPFRVAEWMSISMEMLQFHYGHLLEDDPEVNYGV